MQLIFGGIDWAEDHHDICVESDAGAVLGRKRVPDGIDGVAQIHALSLIHI